MGEFGEILSRTGELLRANILRAAPVLVVLAGCGVMLDTGMATGENERAVSLLLSILTLVAQYWLTRSLLQDLGYTVRPEARMLAFIGMGIVFTAAVVLGLILLVVPGVILFVRWSIGLPLLLTSGEGVFKCLARSWRDTDGYFWPIFGAMAAIYVPGLLAFGLLFASVEFIPDDPFLPSYLLPISLANLAIEGSLIVGWHASAAIFTLIHAAPSKADVFQ